MRTAVRFVALAAILLATSIVVDATNAPGPTWAWQIGFAAYAALGSAGVVVGHFTGDGRR